jgi:hypothetical protein
MRSSKLAKALLILGALVGCVAGLALALGLRLDQLPSWMITVGMYKLAFIAAGGLLVAGALLGRAARGAPHRPEALADADVTPPGVGRQSGPVDRGRRDDRR